MHRASLTARLAVLAGVCAVGAPVAIATAPATADTQATTTLPGSAARVTSDNPGIGAVSGTETHTVEVWMAGDEQAAQQYVDATGTPGSPIYHQFLSPAAYTQQFGPNAAQVRAVRSYLTGAGFAHVQASGNEDFVSASASVSTIDRTFAVQMRRYELTGPTGRATTTQSNDRNLTVPASVSNSIVAVTGLDTAPPQVDHATTPAGAGGSTSTVTTPASEATSAKAAACSQYWAQKTQSFSPAFRGITQAAVPVCGYSAGQVRAAYGLSTTRRSRGGAGKTIALIEVGGPVDMFRALTHYAKANGLPAPRSDQYREKEIGQGDKNPKCLNTGYGEAALDSEAAYAMAPGANQLMVVGNDCNRSKDQAQAELNALLAPLTGNGSRASAAIESTSLGLGGGSSTQKVMHAIALRAAAEGVSLLASSGDVPGVQSPASDPDVTAVGGTTLGIGAQNQRVFETGWSDAFGGRNGHSGPWTDRGILSGAGGGVSGVYREPGYQQSVVPSSLSQNAAGHHGRAVPDIAADADPASGMLMGLFNRLKHSKTSPYTTFIGSGTSLSTPLVAGMVADAEQGQSTNLGFLNPLLYSLAGSSAFHDILPVSPSDPQVDRAYYEPGFTYINHKLRHGFLVGVFDAQNPNGTHPTVTAPGYDTMTGLGTPNGAAFINALRSGK